MHRCLRTACLLLLLLLGLTGCGGWPGPLAQVPTPTRTLPQPTAARPRVPIPPDPPATPLTHDELLQHPLPPVPPGALGTRVWRGTYDQPADAPGPVHPRYGRRETTFTLTSEPATIFAYYRSALPTYGWRYCSTLEHPTTPIDRYRYGDEPCTSTNALLLRVAIYIRKGSPYEVTLVEDLPEPLSWPDPPTP